MRVDDPTRSLEILGWRQARPRWAEDPMWWRNRGLEKHRKRGNKYITRSDRVLVCSNT